MRRRYRRAIADLALGIAVLVILIALRLMGAMGESTLVPARCLIDTQACHRR